MKTNNIKVIALGIATAITASGNAFADAATRTTSSDYVKTIQASPKSGITVIYGPESKPMSAPPATTLERIASRQRRMRPPHRNPSHSCLRLPPL